MTNTYRVILDVAGPLVATVLEIIEGNNGMKLLSVTDAQNPALPPSPLPPTPAPAPAAPAPAMPQQRRINAAGLVMNVLQSGPAGFDEIKHALANGGFAASSAAGTLNKLLKSGHITRGMRGRYALAGGNGSAR